MNNLNCLSLKLKLRSLNFVEMSRKLRAKQRESGGSKSLGKTEEKEVKTRVLYAN